MYLNNKALFLEMPCPLYYVDIISDPFLSASTIQVAVLSELVVTFVHCQEEFLVKALCALVKRLLHKFYCDSMEKIR